MRRAERRELMPGVVVPDRAACKDGFVVMASEVGVLDIAPSNVTT